MLQVRKLVLAVAAATSMASGMAHALGLGEVSVKSALNEPLVAEIELLDTKGLSSEEIRSKLASAEDFSRAGVDRQFFLNNLKFTPVIRQNGKSFVRVTSSQAVREPFLNFLLEVYWPAGRVLKEYTLLLDPPMYTPQELVYRGAPAAAPAAPRVAERPAVAPAAPRQATPGTAVRPAAAASLQGDEYRVRQNDTLWDIALRANRGGGSVHQTMLAIQDLNPGAFIDGNINQLKSGQVLKLPNAEQIRQRTRSQAVAEFQSQVDAWRSGAPVERQLDARRRETAAAAPAQAEQGDNLRLVAGESGETEVGSDGGAAAKSLADQLALTKEQLDSTRLQNEDLASRVEDLSSQVEKLQRLLELKNTQLANLQNMTDEEQDALAEAGQLETAADEVVAVEAGEAVDSADHTEVVAEADVESEVAASEEPDAVETEDEEVAEAEQAVAAVAEPAQPAEAEAKPAPRPAPVAFEPPPEPKGFVDELMENPMFLPGAGAGAALLLLLLLISRRNKARQEQEILPPEDFDDPQGDAGIDLDDVEGLDGEKDVLDGVLEEMDIEIEQPAEFIDEMTSPAQAALGPIDEAENFIAFGRFSQAADVLLKAIDTNPQSEDLRFKLLEVYADLEDRNAFQQQVEELNAMGVAQAEMDALRLRFPHMMGEDDALSLDDILLDLPGVTDEPGLDPAAGSGDLLAEELPGLDDLLNGVEPVEAVAEATDVTESSEDDFSSLLEAVSTDLDEEPEQDAGIEYMPVALEEEAAVADAAGAIAELDENSFELPELEELGLDSLELPEADTLDELTLDTGLSLGEELSLDDLQLEEFAGTADEAVQLAAAGTAEREFGLDLDLSLPLEESEEQISDELDVSSLEADLESIEISFDTLQNDVQETLETAGVADVEAESSADDLEELFNLDAELDLATPELASTPGGDDVLAALEQELDDDFGFLQGDDEDKTKLDLASAWIDMGDLEGAREILDEVIRDGAPEHQELARELLAKLG